VLQQTYRAARLFADDKAPHQHLLSRFTLEVLTTSVVGFYRAATSPYVVDKLVKCVLCSKRPRVNARPQSTIACRAVSVITR